MKRIHIIPWVLLVAVFVWGFGPFTNTIQRVWGGYSTSANVINVAVSPTAAPTFVVPWNSSRYSYAALPLAAVSTSNYACCTYGPNSSGTPSAVPTAGASSNCAVGMMFSAGSSFTEDNAAGLGLWCVSSGTTINWSIVENK